MVAESLGLAHVSLRIVGGEYTSLSRVIEPMRELAPYLASRDDVEVVISARHFSSKQLSGSCHRGLTRIGVSLKAPPHIVGYNSKIENGDSSSRRTTNTHEVGEDGEHVELGIFIRHLLVLAVQELTHQDVQRVIFEKLLPRCEPRSNRGRIDVHTRAFEEFFFAGTQRKVLLVLARQGTHNLGLRNGNKCPCVYAPIEEHAQQRSKNTGGG